MTTAPLMSITDEQIAEIEALCRKEVGLHKNYPQSTILALIARLRAAEAKARMKIGVGDGSGNLFVHGDYDSIKAVQSIIFENEKLRKNAGRYLWLRDEAVYASGTYPMVSLTDDSGEQVSNWLFGGAVDRAIDAAMTEAKP